MSVKPTKSANSDVITFIDISDHPTVDLWMRNLNKKDFKTYVRLFADNNEDRFHKLFGEPYPRPPSNMNRDWGKCWRISRNHLSWFIFTGSKEGTIYLVESSLTSSEFRSQIDKGTSIINFLSFLQEKLCNNE